MNLWNILYGTCPEHNPDLNSSLWVKTTTINALNSFDVDQQSHIFVLAAAWQEPHFGQTPRFCGIFLHKVRSSFSEVCVCVCVDIKRGSVWGFNIVTDILQFQLANEMQATVR